MNDITQSLLTIIYEGGELNKPELNNKHLRMYTHSLCPFAERV